MSEIVHRKSGAGQRQGNTAMGYSNMGYSNPQAVYAKGLGMGQAPEAAFAAARSPDEPRIAVATLSPSPGTTASGGEWRMADDPLRNDPDKRNSCASGVGNPKTPGPLPSVFDGLPVPRDLNAVVDYLRSVAGHDQLATGTSAKPGISALFSSYFTAVLEQAPYLTNAEADTAMQTLMQLASAAREVTVPAEDEPARCMRARRFDAVRQFVEDNLHRSDLTPARAARALGMSVRQLHLLFEPSDTSFSRYMLARRLERSRTMLAQHPNRSVLDIMLACGIESSTVFYRGFRKAFGMNPTDYRRTLSGES